MSEKLSAQERCQLSERAAHWCFDNTESFDDKNVGIGLAYLLWSIAAGDGHPFDATLENSFGLYKELVRLLRANPNGLMKELIEGGFILV